MRSAGDLDTRLMGDTAFGRAETKAPSGSTPFTKDSPPLAGMSEFSGDVSVYHSIGQGCRLWDGGQRAKRLEARC